MHHARIEVANPVARTSQVGEEKSPRKLTILSNRGARDWKCHLNRQWLSRINSRYLTWDFTSMTASPIQIRGAESDFPRGAWIVSTSVFRVTSKPIPLIR